jgi:hypothetical protein
MYESIGCDISTNAKIRLNSRVKHYRNMEEGCENGDLQPLFNPQRLLSPEEVKELTEKL